ncbi:histidine kinase [Paenibacillus alkaliterrae]|uniref:sensor histidine kinase n=1 Tax=Paenibacillus alkaliterrae TaxID=320909 RepID=UPI001F171BDD|nr:histidine kinase [Paenibacillus alkaliterrae]MCF2937977.1 histidine kinase [Paenibacillus alkaliterrae]
MGKGNKFIIRPKLLVYQKIIIVFTVLIIPVYLINLWMNIMGQTFIKNEFSNSNLSNVKFYARQLDDQISFIRNQHLQFLDDSNLQKLSFLGETLDGFEEVQLVNKVKERLATIQNSSDYIVNVGVYIKSYNRTLSTRGGITDIPNSEWDLIESLYNGELKQSLYYAAGRLFFIEPSNNSNIISYLELSKSKFEAALIQLVQYGNDSGVVLSDDPFAQHISIQYDPGVVQGISANMQNNEAKKDFDSFIVQNEEKSYRITYHRISSLGWTLYTYMDENQITKPLRSFNVWFIILSLVSIAIILVFSLSVNLMIHKPINKLIRAFKMLEMDQLHVSIKSKGGTEFGYLYRSFDSMVEKMKVYIQQNYEQKMALQHSELKQLQSQINPHFLYNSFFNIYMICKSGDAENASILAQKLGSYYQFITRSGSDDVLIEKEYRHALDYCDIQSIRFSNRIQVQFTDLPYKCKPLTVPRLIIQPVVENAFEHAFENGMQRGSVYISVSYENDTISICVEDDGSTMTDGMLQMLQDKLAHSSVIHEKTGLINVCSRLRLKYGEASGVFVSRSGFGGLKAKIVISYQPYGG